jgi:hypothetical protein
MQPHPEASLYAFGKLAETGRRLVRAHLLEVAHDLGEELVPTPRTRSLWHKGW